MLSASGKVYTLESGCPTVRDVCQGLVRLPRWNGATKYRWSVAQHSLVVSDLLEPHGPMAVFAGLTHDFAEATGFGDIASPIKDEIEGLRLQESKLRFRVVAEQTGLSITEMRLLQQQWDSPFLHDADKASAYAERYVAIDGGGPLAGSDVDPLHSRALFLMQKYGYGSVPWPEETLFPFFVSTVYATFKQAVAALHTLSAGAPGAVPSGTVASLPTGVATRGALGGGSGTSASTRTIVEGMDGPRVDLLQCSTCGAVFQSNSLHQCHPEAKGPQC